MNVSRVDGLAVEFDRHALAPLHGIKLRLADKTFLTVDFAVMDRDGVMELHETKGGPGVFTEDAKVKMKVATEMYPFRFKVAFRRAKKHGGGWLVKEKGYSPGVARLGRRVLGEVRCPPDARISLRPCTPNG